MGWLTRALAGTSRTRARSIMSATTAAVGPAPAPALCRLPRTAVAIHLSAAGKGGCAGAGRYPHQLQPRGTGRVFYLRRKTGGAAEDPGAGRPDPALYRLLCATGAEPRGGIRAGPAKACGYRLPGLKVLV